jgi:NAD(P)-dependent dehydrogenase (short-subunit alcohol dehydrogenase family)/acyl carrier protein
VISNDVQEVESADVCSPEKATILGPCKVIPQEYDTITCRYIDIAVPEPHSVGEDALIGQLVAEISAKTDDPVVAYRGGRRWVQTFEPLQLDSESEPVRSLRERGVYLITGGFGGIGSLLAGYLADTVRARLILTGRSALPVRDAWHAWLEAHGDEDEVSRKIRSFLALEACGAEVMIASADVADEEQMRAVVAQAYERFGAIHGVIHAAGIAGEQAFRLIPAADRDACEAQFHPKVYGTYVLQSLFQGCDLDFCLLFSSNTAILGGLGSTAYTAANLFLDALAHRQRSVSTQWISTNWDGWLLHESGNLNAYQTSIDKYAMLPKESLESFRRIVSMATDQQVIVSTGDLTSRLNIWIMREAAGAQAHDGSAARHPRPVLKTSYIPPEDELQQTVAAIWQELLGIEQVGIHDNFFDLGGHSLLGLKIVARLKSELNVDIPVVSLFEGPTISALAKVIGQNQQAAPAYEESRSQGAGRKQRIREKRQRNRSAVQEQGHERST